MASDAYSSTPQHARLMAEWQAANERAAAVLKEACGGTVTGHALVQLKAAESRAAAIARQYRANPIQLRPGAQSR
jgi:hypothetical protein